MSGELFAGGARTRVVRVLTLVVALLVLLSGCNAFGGSSTGDRETLTAVDVPDVAPAETPTVTPSERDCLVPRPADAPNQSVTDPPNASALPRNADGTINGSALVGDHARTLPAYSYHMAVDGNTDVWAMPELAAFTYEGVGLRLATPWAYAVGGTLYTLSGDGGDLVLDEEPFAVDSPTHSRYQSVLTGQRWLAQRIGWFNYTVVDTRYENSTELRVLRDTLDSEVLLESDAQASGVFRLNSTVAVDRRGIIREVRHVRHIEYADETGFPNETEVSTLRIDDLGIASLHRPAAFCVTEPDEVLTAVQTVRSPASPPTTQPPTTLPGTTQPPAIQPPATATVQQSTPTPTGTNATGTPVTRTAPTETAVTVTPEANTPNGS